MYKTTSVGNNIQGREECLVKQSDYCRLLHVKWHTLYYSPCFFRDCWHWLFDQSDNEVGNGKPQKTHPLPLGTQVANNSCLNWIMGLGKFSKVFQNLQGIFGPYSKRRTMLVCLGLCQFTHTCTANAGTLGLKPVPSEVNSKAPTGFSGSRICPFVRRSYLYSIPCNSKVRISRIKLS